MCAGACSSVRNLSPCNYRPFLPPETQQEGAVNSWAAPSFNADDSAQGEAGVGAMRSAEPARTPATAYAPTPSSETVHTEICEA